MCDSLARFALLASMFALSAFAAGTVAAQSTENSTATVKTSETGTEIEAADVFVRVEFLRAELELLRFHMGRPQNEQPELAVKGAAPREVYFQALTLFRKANRLRFEHTRNRSQEPTFPKGEIRPANVLAMVNSAIEQVQAVKLTLEISKSSSPIASDSEKRPTDVFRAIVQANRQLNLLLERQFAPSDVFQQVTFAVGYTSRLLEQFDDATTIPKAPEFEAGKRPGDVYRRLVHCFDMIRNAAQKSGVQMLELKSDQTRIAQSAPSDVYDIASLLVSELAYLHSKLPDSKPPRPVYFPGRKFPSDVYQRVGILEQQLTELEKHISDSPGWLDQGNKK